MFAQDNSKGRPAFFGRRGGGCLGQRAGVVTHLAPAEAEAKKDEGGGTGDGRVGP